MEERDYVYIVGMVLLVLLLALLVHTIALAQQEPAGSDPFYQSHAAGHNDYVNWASRKTANCCNNQDCGELADENWRKTNEGVEIKIDGEWCPVLPEHYLTKGKSPNWSKAHACIIRLNHNQTTPCNRLLCFAGLPEG